MREVDELEALIRAELEKILPSGLSPLNSSQAACRRLHTSAVELELERSRGWISKKLPKYQKYFANGADIEPAKIKPTLVYVDEEWQSDLFRLARYTWSLPFTSGYGRRLRYLIIDQSNDKLIGILGLQSPPLDFPARDRLYTYPTGKKVELVNQTMDIFTLGSVPPYNQLLGSKLIALAATSREIVTAYKRKYNGRESEITKQCLPAQLVALTTTSAFGRSSIYNRLRYEKVLVAESLGYVKGYGTFHLAPVYALIREYLKAQGMLRSGFGVGPRIGWQNCTNAFKLLGLPRTLLKHDVEREVFLFPLATNLTEYMEGRTQCPQYHNRKFNDLADWWLKRWMLPRSERVLEWRDWDNAAVEQMLIRQVQNEQHS